MNLPPRQNGTKQSSLVAFHLCSIRRRGVTWPQSCWSGAAASNLHTRQSYTDDPPWPRSLPLSQPTKLGHLGMPHTSTYVMHSTSRPSVALPHTIHTYTHVHIPYAHSPSLCGTSNSPRSPRHEIALHFEGELRAVTPALTPPTTPFVFPPGRTKTYQTP